jgi:WD40 repeat protein
MDSAPSEPVPLNALAEEFVDRFRRGERPSLTEYTDKYPELADEIRELFPALVMMEDVGTVVGRPALPQAGPLPEQLGDFRILREIGHGGMGVVYEAVQQSLGRHVALKVLPFHARMEPTLLERFRREARAAAQLHHTNIVPVFGIDEHEGIHYYAMQFIQGQSLDEVIHEVNRLREAKAVPVHTMKSDRVAQALLSGRFQTGAAEDGKKGVSWQGENQGEASKPIDPRSSILDPSLAAVAKDPSALTSQSEAQYFRSVARVGVQVAEALEYAHRHGILRIALAEREWSTNQLGRVEQLLNDCPADLHGWEWHYLKRLRLPSLPPLRHPAGVMTAVFSPNGRWIASGSGDGKVTVWNATNGKERCAFQAHKEHMRHVDFSPDGRRLATAGDEGSAKVWDFDPQRAEVKETPLQTLTRHHVMNVAFSPDGKRLASAGMDDKTVRVWDVATGQEVFPDGLRGHTELVLFVAYSPDGQSLASASDDATVKIWDARTGQERRTLRGHSGHVQSVAFSPDGQWLASVAGGMGNDAEVKVWDARRGVETLTLLGHVAEVRVVALSPDGTRLATGGKDGNVKLWDLTTGQETLTLRGHVHGVACVAFSRDGNRIVSASQDRTVRVWNGKPLEGEEGEEVLTLRGRQGRVEGVAFSPDGRRLASAGTDGTVCVWDLKPPSAANLLIRLQGHLHGFGKNAVFSSDGRFLAAGGGWYDRNTGRLRVRDTSTWKELYTDPPKGSPVAFSPDGRYLAACFFTTVEILDARIGLKIHSLQGHGGVVLGIAFSPDPRVARLVSASRDGTVRVWDVRTGKQIADPLHTDFATSVAFSGDGRRLASGSEDRIVRVWDATTWELLEQLPDPTGGVHCVAFHPKDDRMLAWGSTDSTVKIVTQWDAPTKEIRILHGHTSWVESVAFSPDGEWIASASRDGTVKIWRVCPLPPSE